MRSRVQENIPLAPLTTLGIGGPARYLVEVSDEGDIGAAVGFARSRSLPVMVLGAGSNLLVSDDGFAGLAIRVVLDGVRFDGARLRAGAGVDWDGLVADCVRRRLYGVECLSGIPGLVGGTPIQNVGAYGQEVSEVISSVRVYDLADDTLRELPAPECGFGYRISRFNTGDRGRYVVLGVEYLLKDAGEPCLSYPDLVRHFGKRSAPTLGEVRHAVLMIRRGKAMLLVDGDPDCRSAGSFFRNPVLTTTEFIELEERRSLAGIEAPVPAYRTGDSVKVPAAWLVEQAGFPKGTTDGPVGLSTRHALALVNRGKAEATDVLRFAGAIRHGVEDRFGVRLRTEPAFVGFSDEVVASFGAVVA